MNNIKKFYKNNRIYCILMGVSIFCLALIAVLGIVYFVNQTKNDKYGDRLNGIESVQITDDHINEMVSEIEKNELVEKASISVKGKIVYITVTLKDGKRQDAEGIAVKSLSGLTEDEKAFYDVSFAFTNNDTNRIAVSIIHTSTTPLIIPDAKAIDVPFASFSVSTARSKSLSLHFNIFHVKSQQD